jgi:hypothetical protein
LSPSPTPSRRDRIAELEGIVAGIEVAFGLPEDALSTQARAAEWLALLGEKVADLRAVQANLDAIELTDEITRTIVCLPDHESTPIERLLHASQQLLTAFRNATNIPQ